MQIDRRFASHFDWTLFGLALGLILVGVLTIYSATSSMVEEHSSAFAVRQFYWFLVGLMAMVLAFAVDYHRIDLLAYPFYGVVLLSLLLVDTLGTMGGGSQRWLQIGPITLQPSEVAKLAVVFFLAKHFQYDEPHTGFRLRDLWSPFVLIGPLLLLVLVQPDLGTAVIIFAVFV
ncbi:MAG: FtsW/RodA/SpoVE family cell cycle protein, partial [Candidatus Binatia bacterium]